MRLIERIRTDKRFLKRLFFIISFVLIVYVCLPLIVPDLVKPFYGISKVLTVILNTILGISTTLIELIALTGQAYKKEKIKRAIQILLFMILPFILVQISEPILKIQLENQESSDAAPVEENPDDEPYQKITVNYQAPLFNHIVSDEIRLHQADYRAAILEKICTKDEYINHNSDFAEYEKNTESAREFENVYIGILQQNSFETLRDERIRMIDQIISYRVQADNHYLYSENQRLVGIGYQNMASEQYYVGKTDDAVKDYEISITWFLKAMTTAYNEPDSNADTFDQMIGDIIRSYQQISALTNEYTVEHKNAEALILIYQNFSGWQFVSDSE